MRNLKNFLFITVPVFAVCIILAEIILYNWFWVADPYQQIKETEYNPYIPSEFPPYLHMSLASEEGIKGLDKRMIFSTNNAGFRGDTLHQPKPVTEFRVFIIGGSTTACFYLDDKKSIERKLQESLQKAVKEKTVKVYNAGKPGDASPEHIAMLSNRIMHLQPDLIILFSGFNDFLKNINHYDYTHFKRKPFPTALKFHQKATRFQIPRRIYYALVSEERYRQQITLKTNYTSYISYEQKFPVSDSMPHVDPSPYRKNLETIAGSCLFNKVSLVFMPNQSSWNSNVDPSMSKRHWLCIRDGIRYSHVNMDRGLTYYNNEMKAVAAEHNVPLFDLPASIPKSSEYFYDDCHFTNAGAAFAAESLSSFLIQNNIVQ